MTPQATDKDRASGWAAVNGTRLWYETFGIGHPLVLIHAGIADSRMWDEQCEAFARQYQVVRYDLRGFGKSAAATGPFSHVEDLAQLLTFLRIPSAYLLGSSMGGQVAIDFTLEHPSAVDALIRVSSGVGQRSPSPALIAGWREVEAAIKAGDVARGVELELQMWVDGPRRGSDQVDPSVRDRVRMMDRALLERAAAEEGVPDEIDPPAIERLAEVRVPTLIVVGDQDVDDVLSIADVLATGIRRAGKIVVPGTGHMLNMEQPETFNRLVLDFLHDISSAEPASSASVHPQP